MTLTANEASVELRSVLNTAWLPSGHPILWDGKEDVRPKDGTTPWAFVVYSVLTSEVAALADERIRRYRRFGTLTVQVFTPRGDGYTEGEALGKLLTDAMESKRTPGGLIFRKVNSARIGRSGLYSQINVTSQYEYDEVR